MKRYEARELVDRIHLLSYLRVNPVVLASQEPFLRELGLDWKRGTELDQGKLDALTIELVGWEDNCAAELYSFLKADCLYIIRNDGAGESDDPKAIDFNTLSKVVNIDCTESTKVIELPDGKFVRVPYKSYAATSASYGDGFVDTCTSNPEGFMRLNKEWKQFGAASALLARLLEAKAEGLV